MDLPRISVVVPSFNQAGFLAECLESILSQGYPDLELIVMDGGSQDGSVDVIRRYESRISYWQSQPDGGQSAAINAGMAKATGEVACWLNSDDLFCEGALDLVGRAARTHPGFGLYIGNGVRLDQATGRKILFSARPVRLSRAALKSGAAYILQPSTFFLREAWNRVGGLDPSLHFCMDWDITIRIADLYPAVLIEAPLAVGREYETTKTASGRLRRAFEICEMCRRHTGEELSLGAAHYLFETLLQEGVGDRLGFGFYRQVAGAYVQLVASMAALHGSGDGLPASNDPGDVIFSAAAANSDAADGAGLSNRLRQLRPVGLRLRLVSTLLAVLVPLGIVPSGAATERVRRRLLGRHEAPDAGPRP